MAKRCPVIYNQNAWVDSMLKDTRTNNFLICHNRHNKIGGTAPTRHLVSWTLLPEPHHDEATYLTTFAPPGRQEKATILTSQKMEGTDNPENLQCSCDWAKARTTLWSLPVSLSKEKPEVPFLTMKYKQRTVFSFFTQTFSETSEI